MFPMARPTPPISAPAFGKNYIPNGMFPGGVQQLGNIPMQQGAVVNSRGILSKLFGGANKATAVPNMYSGASAYNGVLPNVLGGANTGGMMQNVFGGANAVSGLSNIASGAQAAGSLSNLTSGAKAAGGLTNVMNMLQNAQKAIGVVQTVGPMVQQYGPLVKSLPALISIMRGSGSTDNVDATEDTEITPEDNGGKVTKNDLNKIKSPQNSNNNDAKKIVKKRQNKTHKQTSKKEVVEGIPSPKLYI